MQNIITVAGKKLQFSSNGMSMGKTWDSFFSDEVQSELAELDEQVSAGGPNLIHHGTVYVTPAGEEIVHVEPTWSTDGELYLRV